MSQPMLGWGGTEILRVSLKSISVSFLLHSHLQTWLSLKQQDNLRDIERYRADMNEEVELASTLSQLTPKVINFTKLCCVLEPRAECLCFIL